MSQSQTIANYLNGNYLISGEQSQLVTLEYTEYQKCFRFLNYQILANLNTDKPVLLVDLDSGFHRGEFEMKLSPNFTQITKLELLIDTINDIQQKNKFKYLEVLIRGYELSQKDAIIRTALKIENIQITLQVHTRLTKLSIVPQCRIVLNCKDDQIYCQMIIVKQNGHSFIKSYQVDIKYLKLNRLKINKIPRNEQQQVDMQSKLNPTFNLVNSQQQQQAKDELDLQINPYKTVITKENKPKIYSQEGDEKQMRIDIDENDEDQEEIEEYEG